MSSWQLTFNILHIIFVQGVCLVAISVGLNTRLPFYRLDGQTRHLEIASLSTITAFRYEYLADEGPRSTAAVTGDDQIPH